MFYFNMDINDIIRLSGSPIEIAIKLKTKKTINFHCGKTELEEEEKQVGWCATKLDGHGK